MDIPLGKIIFLAVLVLLSGYFSATETAFFSTNKIRLKALAGDGNKRAKKVLKILDDFDSLLATILIGNNLVNIAATAIATILFIDISSVSGKLPSMRWLTKILIERNNSKDYAVDIYRF